MATQPEANEEQLNSLDAMIAAEEAGAPAEKPDATPPVVEEPVKTEAPAAPEAPVQPEEPPVPEAEAAPEPPSEPVVSKPAEEEQKVPLPVHLHKTHKLKERLERAEQRAVIAERRADELAARQAKEADPLETWQANAENEGVAIPKDVLQKHDAFVRAGVQREAAITAAGAPPLSEAAKVRVTAALNAMPKPAKWVVDYADGRNWFTTEEAREIAIAPDPGAKAFEFAADHFDTFGEPDEVALYHQLFPPQAQPQPTPPAAPTRAAAPRAKVAQAAAPPRAPVAPAPKPKETTNEPAEVYEPDGFTSKHRRITSMFFPGK